MPPPNEQWDFIQILMDRIEKRDVDIALLREKYGKEKALLNSWGDYECNFKIITT